MLFGIIAGRHSIGRHAWEWAFSSQHKSMSMVKLSGGWVEVLW